MPCIHECEQGRKRCPRECPHYKASGFADTFSSTLTDFGHLHIVAPKDYDEPPLPTDGSQVQLGMRLMLAVVLVACCAAGVVLAV